MSDTDRIAAIERQIVELSSKTADIPVRWASSGSGSGSGDSKRTSLLKAGSGVDGATDSMGVRTPGTSTDYTVIKGDTPSTPIENWSLTAISASSYMTTMQIGDDDVIVDVFC